MTFAEVMQEILLVSEVFFIVYLIGYASFLFASVIVGGNEVFEGLKKKAASKRNTSRLLCTN